VLSTYPILVAAFDEKGEVYTQAANEVLPLVAALSVWRASPISWMDEGRRRLGIFLA